MHLSMPKRKVRYVAESPATEEVGEHVLTTKSKVNLSKMQVYPAAIFTLYCTFSSALSLIVQSLN